MKLLDRRTTALSYTWVLLVLSGCASVFPSQQEESSNLPISDPFGNFYPAVREKNQGIVFKSTQGDRSVQLALPGENDDLKSLTVPMSAGDYKSALGSNSQSSTGGLDDQYVNRKPTSVDHEIAATFPTGNPETEKQRQEIEASLGLTMSEEFLPKQDASYLGKVDRAKQLFKSGRFEASLLEIDALIRDYPTDPKVHSMKGTLLDKLGFHDLAIKSWEEALNLKPGDLGLKKFVEKKRQLAAMKGESTP